MKVLYTFYHGAAFAWSLVHKLSVHPDDDAYLLVADGWDWCAGKPKLLLLLLLRFVELGIFKDVYLYDNRLGRDADKFDTLEKCEKDIFNGMNKRLKEQRCDIKSFDRIYSNTDGEDTMGIYLSLNKIKFYSFEFGRSLLCYRTEEWIRENYKMNKGYCAALLKHKTLHCQSEYQSFIFYPDSNMKGFPEERCEVFDIESAAFNLSDEVKQQILKCFDLDKFVCKPNTTMLMLQSNWLPGEVFNANEYIREKFSHHWFYMYCAIQCMLDLYVPKGTNIVLKTHPTVLIDETASRKYFGGVFAFHSLFTALLTKTLLPGVKPEYKVLLGSSANKQMDASASDIYCPGVWLFPCFYYKFFIAVDILDKAGCLYGNAGERFGSIGDAGKIMNYNRDYLPNDINNLISVNFPSAPEYTKQKYCVIQNAEELTENVVQNNDFVICTDVWEMMTPEKIEEVTETAHMIQIKVGKQPLKKKANIIYPLDDEYVYVISGNLQWIKKLEDYALNRENSYAGFKMAAEVEKVMESRLQHKIAEYEQGKALNLYDLFVEYGRNYINNREDEIRIGGEITEQAVENMKKVSVKFSGNGKIKYS